MKYLLAWLLVVVALSAYDPQFGKEMAVLSEAAYESMTSIETWSCGPCSKYKITDAKPFFNNTWKMQGFVGYSPSRSAIVVAFRGSSNTKNWIDDFDATQINYAKCPGCKIHQGFYLGYMTVSSSIKTQIQLLLSKYRNSPIYVTGHSLGGAIGVVAALDIYESFGSNIRVYTFGQPRVGNAAFAKFFNQQIPDSFRVVHYADMVPHLAPTPLNYYHQNTQVWYTEDMKSFKTCVNEDKTCMDSISPTKLSTADHSMSNYIKIVGSHRSSNLRSIVRLVREMVDLI